MGLCLLSELSPEDHNLSVSSCPPDPQEAYSSLECREATAPVQGRERCSLKGKPSGTWKDQARSP